MSANATPQILSSILQRPLEILLVEDSPSDAAMTVYALREGHVTNNVSVVGDGEAAMAFLRRQHPYSDAPRPDLILLDINLPRKDGLEVLAEVRADDSLTVIPIIILTTSSADSDILSAYKLHANSYVTKPVGLDDFLLAIRGIESFWLTLVRLPDGIHVSPAVPAKVSRGSAGASSAGASSIGV